MRSASSAGEVRPVLFFELEFESYEAAKSSGPYVVTVMENGASEEITKRVGFCEESASCAGPITSERITLSLHHTVSHPGQGIYQYVIGAHCVGLDGSVNRGFDISYYGCCER